MKIFLIILTGLFVVACVGSAASTPVVTTEDNNFTDVPIELMAAEFRDLRTRRGHFNGGTWNAKVDKWMGRKHRLMLALGLRLASGQYQKSEIIQLLGFPDQIVREGDYLFDLITTLPNYDALTAVSYEFLVYYWRGRHDFLFFTCQDSMIIRSGWWYAGE